MSGACAFADDSFNSDGYYYSYYYYGISLDNIDYCNNQKFVCVRVIYGYRAGCINFTDPFNSIVGS